MKKILTLIAIVYLSTALFSQAPQSFNYQGVARDLTGTPISNQAISLSISVLKHSINGIAVYTETHDVTTNNLGLFTLSIGTGVSIGDSFAEINWGDGPYFLAISMDENGGDNYEFLGASQLLSVPYALYAENGSVWEDIQQLPDQYGFSSGAYYHVDDTKIAVGKGFESALSYPSFPMLSLNEDYFDNQVGPRAGLKMALIRRSEYQDEPTLEFTFGLTQGVRRNFSFRANGATKLFIGGDGNVGVGTVLPKSKLQVSNGDVYIEDINSGIIMKSPNGQCWRATISNDGQFISTEIICPE